MRTQFKQLLILAFIVAFCAFCYFIGRHSRFDGTAIEGLAISSKHLNFGESFETNRLPWSLPITNLRNEDVVIERFETSCGCGQIEPSSLVIPKGETRTITVHFNLRSSPGNPSALRRDIGVQIVPVFPGKKPALKGWIVHGVVVTALSVPTQLIHFREIEADKATQTQTCLFYSSLNKESFTISVEPPLIDAVIKPIVPSKAYELHLTPKKHLLREGSFECNLTIHAITDNRHKASIEHHIIVRGKVHGVIRAFPEDLSLGTCSVGKEKLQSVTLRDTSGCLFTYDTLDTSSPHIAIHGVPQKDGSLLHLVLRVPIQETGPHRHEVTLRVKRGSARFDVPLSIVYHGIQ